MKGGLLLKYLNGACSKKQEAKIQSWLAKDIAHVDELKQLKLIWSEMDQLKSFNAPDVKRDWKKMSALIGASGTSPDIYQAKGSASAPNASPEVIIAPKPIVNTQTTKFTPRKSAQSAKTGIATASKIVSTTKGIATNFSTPPISSNDKVENGIPMIDKIVYAIAAMAVLCILGFWVFSVLKKENPNIEFATTEYSKEIILPDGTEVLLDPFSKLTYPREMEENRRVSLLGSATFDVMADTERLVLESGDVSVMTLGTEFDLEAIDGAFEVKCNEGRVRFFETENIDNNVEVNEGEKFRFKEGVFENITEYQEIVEPEIVETDLVTLSRLLDLLMEESEWKVITVPSMPIDESHEILVNLDQSYVDLLESLKSKIDIEYSFAQCDGCFIISRMKAK